MNCAEVEPYLSSYFDLQLEGELKQAVAIHIRTCTSCRSALETFASLSKLTKKSFVAVTELDLPNLRAPEELWARIDHSLQETSETTPDVMISRASLPGGRAHPERKLSGRLIHWTVRWQGAALAALLLIAVGAGIYWFQGHGVPHHASQRHLAHYINTFVEDADAAQQILISDYGAQQVNLRQASRYLGYQPVIPERLPEGYALEAIYVMEMECCNCAQYVCQREGAEPIVIFEHGEAHASHLADCSTQETRCNGECCQLGQTGKEWVASWQVGPRQITLVGVRDAKEVEHFMAHFKEPDISQTKDGA